MPVRDTMLALIGRVRLLINDPLGPTQTFSDQDIQDVLDESRMDMRNVPLKGIPTFSGSTIQYLDYYAELRDWEADATFKQFLTVPVTPSAFEPIPAHWTFAQSTLPPIMITGKTYDIYRAAADLLERLSAQWMLRYSMTVDGQNLQRGMVVGNIQKVIQSFRMKQRPRTIIARRTDLATETSRLSLKATEIDYMASGDKGSS